MIGHYTTGLHGQQAPRLRFELRRQGRHTLSRRALWARLSYLGLLHCIARPLMNARKNTGAKPSLEHRLTLRFLFEATELAVRARHHIGVDFFLKPAFAIQAVLQDIRLTSIGSVSHRSHWKGVTGKSFCGNSVRTSLRRLQAHHCSLGMSVDHSGRASGSQSQGTEGTFWA